MVQYLKRVPDWPRRLHAFVDAAKRRPFDWQSHDCGRHWAAGAVKAITGEDLAKGYSYKTVRGAVGAMKRAGFDNVADLVASILPEIHISQARVGDIAAIPKDDPFGYTLGIVNGEMILVLREDGMGLVPLFDAARVFRVGD